MRACVCCVCDCDCACVCVCGVGGGGGVRDILTLTHAALLVPLLSN